jgi:hypothetical protein
MAIKRCPYCKAIIDEEDKYCNNCGTQLLFPEDESIEEEIPGDKIVDEEEEGGEEEVLKEEEATAEEDEGLREEEGEEEREEELQAEQAELQGEQIEEQLAGESGEVREEECEFEEGKEEGEGEEEEEAEIEAEEWQAEEARSEKPEGEESGMEAVERPAFGEMIEEKEEEETRIPREEDRQPDIAKEPPAMRIERAEPEKKYKISIEEDELVFKTKDLEHLTGTVDEGKKELEVFLDSFKKGEDEKKTTPAALDESSVLSRDEESAPGTREEIPPWASGLKEPPSVPASAPTQAETGAEESLTGKPWTTDSGIGIPEKVTQKTLPFADTAALKLEVESRGEEAATYDEERERPARLPLRLKSKLVDLAFITALWLICLWFAAQVIGVSFFRLVFGSPIPVLAFYLILLVLYFFLFLYFLGETLGDHYFSGEDEDLHPEE